jgi:hypothetical protein
MHTYKILYCRGGRHAAQKGFSAAQSRIESLWLFDILDDFPLFTSKYGTKSSYFMELFPNAAQRPVWVGHPCFIDP